MLENEWFSIFIFSSGTLFSNETVQRTPREIGHSAFSHSYPPLVVLELTMTGLVLSGTPRRAVILRGSSRVTVKTILLFERRTLRYLGQCY